MRPINNPDDFAGLDQDHLFCEINRLSVSVIFCFPALLRGYTNLFTSGIIEKGCGQRTKIMVNDPKL